MENIIQSQNESSKDSHDRNEFFRKVNEMFEFKSKLSKLVGEEVIKSYKETYFYLFDLIEKKELPTLKDFFSGNTQNQDTF